MKHGSFKRDSPLSLKSGIFRRLWRLDFRSLSVTGLLCIGLLLRFIPAPFTSQPYDVAALYTVNNDVSAGLGIYTTNSFSYPPLWAYIEFPALGLASWLTNPSLFSIRTDSLGLSSESWRFPPIITSPLFNVICKLPLIVADAMIGLILYDFVKEVKDERRARLSFILWFFNPLVIFVGSFHGQFDVLPTLMTLLSFCLLCKRSYFGSGIAIGLGTLFKIYPIFLVPLYFFSIPALETDRSSRGANSLRRVIYCLLLFVAGVVIPFCLFVVPLANSGIIHNVLSRTETVTSLGGLTLFNIAYLPGFEWLWPFVSSHSQLVSLGLTLVCFTMALMIGFIVFRRRKDFLKAFILGHIAILLTVYLTSLTVNPQYVLWIIPFLVLNYGLCQFGITKLLTLSISGLAFLIGLSGLLFFFYPLAAFTHLLNIDAIYANVYFFEHSGGWVILVVSGILGAFTLILCLRDTLKSLLKTDHEIKTAHFPRQEQQENHSSSPLRFRSYALGSSRLLILVVAILMIGQTMVYTQPLIQQRPTLYVRSINASNVDHVKVDYSLTSGSFPVDMQVFTTPLTYSPNSFSNMEILIYYDKDYPSSFVSEAGWIGLLDHIPIELELGGYNGSVRIVNAVELQHRMQKGHEFTVIIPSGVLPDTLHAKNETSVGDWLRSGGTMIWIGDAFAYLSGQKGRVTEPFSAGNYSQIQNQVLGFTLFNETSKESERFAYEPSTFSEALDLRFPDALVGPYVSEVLKNGGLVFGRTTAQNVRTSIAYVPVGSGSLILFGGGVGRAFTATGEDVVAHDIAQILCSGFPFSTAIAEYRTYELNRWEDKSASITVALPEDENVTGILVVGFSKSPYVRFFARQFCLFNEP